MSPRKSDASKFSSVVDESDEGVYKALLKFCYKLGHENVNDANIMMSFDEIIGELLEELVKGLRHYPDLPYQQKLAVIRRMLDNRISELRYKYYVTHRKAHNNDLSYESDLSSEESHATEDKSKVIVSDHGADEPAPETWLMSIERVTDTRNKLSDMAKKVFDCVVYGGNRRLENILVIHLQRSATLKTAPTMKIKPWMVSDALLMDEKEVNSAFEEIKMAYRQVCSD